MGRNRSTEGSVKITAAEAIANALDRAPRVPAPSKEALKQLKKILEANDEQPDRMRRVSKEITIKVLQSHGWTGRTADILDKLCAETLGRKSFRLP